LREEEPISLYAKQLDIVTADRSKRDNDLEIWLREFSAMHGLDLTESLRRGKLSQFVETVTGWPFRTWRRWKTTKLRPRAHDLSDVYMATIAAAEYLRNKK
jgi:hypothetical protein